MSSRSTVFRVAVLGFLASLSPGCGGESATVPETSDGLFIWKITYFRATPEGKTKRPEPTFRAVMSESWRDRVANGPREPLAKAAPGKIYMGYISDSEMSRYVKKLKELGVDDLKARKPEDFDPDDFSRKASNPQETSFTRVFTVGDDKGARSYYYRDQQSAPDLIQKFVRCEAFVARACENSINTSVSTDAMPGRPR
ncbi:MAG TPA: hypothetical protein VKW04_02190 [Planctomycetota bacterium]|nr:hypothetical protein [Planctomycetota bacterium]